MEFLQKAILTNFNFWIYVVLMMIGLYAMISKNNLIKKLIGMSIFQTAIILFYVSIGAKFGAGIPILNHDQLHGAMHEGEHEGEHGEGHGEHQEVDPALDEDGNYTIDLDLEPEVVDLPSYGHPITPAEAHGSAEIDPTKFANPLPHVLMLTAIVVGVATLGLALAITQLLYRDFGTIEEDEIIAKLNAEDADGDGNIDEFQEDAPA